MRFHNPGQLGVGEVSLRFDRVPPDREDFPDDIDFKALPHPINFVDKRWATLSECHPEFLCPGFHQEREAAEDSHH
tara:strand:- start:6446 stop:6673 length:228 start_codon:yes stop_codon:yes gene_type:complete